MYKLLIIDDEPIIANGLYDLLYEESGFELDVYKAYSGFEAFELLNKTKIDIVLTDICIPDMNGLDIYRRVKGIWPNCRVVFLSGHNDFEYIQFAVRNDAIDYIIKNEGDDAILRAVKKAVEEIRREINTELLLEKAKESVNLAAPLLKWKCLNGLLEGEDFVLAEMQRQFGDYNIPLDINIPVLLFAGRVDLWPDNTCTMDKIKIAYGIQNIADEFLLKEMKVISVTYERSWIIWFIQTPLTKPGVTAEEKINTMDWEHIILYVNGTMDRIQSACKQIYGVSVSFALNAKPCEWEDVPVEFDILKMFLNKEMGLYSKLLLVHDTGGDMADPLKSISRTNMEDDIRNQLRRINQLEALLECGQKSEFLNLFGEILKVIEKLESINGDLGTEAYYTIAGIFLKCLNRWKLTERIGQKVNIDILMKLEGHSSWNEISEYFIFLSECIFNERNDESLHNVNRIFGLMKSHIEQNLNGDLSLLKLSEIIHFNPSYLSRLFKRVTGKCIKEYISELKLNKARELLSHSNFKINEVASALGFDTQSYFTRFFKKNTGLSPQEYRDKYK